MIEITLVFIIKMPLIINKRESFIYCVVLSCILSHKYKYSKYSYHCQLCVVINEGPRCSYSLTYGRRQETFPN